MPSRDTFSDGESRCSEEPRLRLLESGAIQLAREVEEVRAMIVGPVHEGESGGLRKDVRSIADSLREFKAENKFLKWGIGILIMLKTPDAISVFAELLKKGTH